MSELVRPRPNVGFIDWIAAQAERSLYISVITLGELRKGVARLAAGRRKSALDVWLRNEVPRRFGSRMLDVDAVTILKWGEVVAQCERGGKSLAVLDSLIAATALRHGLDVVTCDDHNFLPAGTTVVNPWS